MEVFLYLYLISLVLIIAGDQLWLSVVAKSFYQSRLGELSGSINWRATFTFYIVFTFGITFFATHTGYVSGFLWKAALFGGVFGLVTYSMRNLSNLAMLKGWSIMLTITEILWGTVFSTLVAIIAMLAVKSLV